MSEEAKQAVQDICQKILSGKVMQQAVEIAVDLHNACIVEIAAAEGKENGNAQNQSV